MDTIPANISTTEVLTPGGSRSSTIDTPGDRDWFRVNLTGGFTYDIILEGTGTATELPSVEYLIYDALGNFITNEADFGTVGIERNSFTPDLSGTYFIAASGDSNSDTGDYVLSLGNDEARNTVDTEQTIEAGGAVAGTIDAFGDRDWYRISLEAGFSYNVRIEGTGTATELPSVEYLIYDSMGNFITNEADFGTLGIEVGTFSPDSDGIYYIAASGDSNTDLGDYILSVGTDDVRASIATTHSISDGGSVTGSIEAAGDQDWYEIDLQSGFSYNITLEGTGTATELSRVEFRIYDSNGNFLADEPDFGTLGFESAIFTPDSDGTYYIAALGDSTSDLGDYILSVGTDDARNSVATEREIAAGQSLTGEIEGFGDSDWYKISLVAGEDYTITLEGDGSQNSLGRVEFSIRDATGTVLENESDFGQLGIETAVFTPTTSGTYFISAEGDNGSSTGNYILSVEGDRPLTTGSNQDDVLIGDAANENFNGLQGDDTIVAGGGNDLVNGDQGDDVLLGGTGNDTLNGDDGADSLFGGDGDDVMIGGAGADNLRGGSGTDTATYRASSTALVIDLDDESSNTGDAAGDSLTSVEVIIGSNFADRIIGDAGDNVLKGANGNDVLIGRGGRDELHGGQGNDRLFGGGNGDILIGGRGADQHFGDAGTNFASYSDSVVGLRADLVTTATNTGIADGDTYTDIGGFIGSDFDDNLLGNDLVNVTLAGEGNDTVSGRGRRDLLSGEEGNDRLFGNGGRDELNGGLGADELSGGAGEDYAVYSDAAIGVRADLLNAGINTNEAAGDTYASIENLRGSALDDSLRGDNAENRVEGGDGNDALFGRGGSDFLDGGAGSDILIGGNGSDFLDGGEDNDTMSGGSGADRFIFRDSQSIDEITDFASGSDLILLDSDGFASLNAGSLSAGNFVDGTTAMDSNDYILYQASTGRLFYDPDGDGAAARVRIGTLSNNEAIDSDDFLII